MAGNFVDTLLIGIGLDTSKVAEGAKDVGRQIASGVRDSVAQIPDQITPALETAAGKAKSIFSGIWSQILGPLAGAFTIGSAVSNYISNSMSAGELAERLKVDVEEIQIWSGAMERAGGSASALQGTIEKLNASGKAQGDAIGVLLDLAEKADTMTKEAFYAKARELEIDEKTIEVLAQGSKALDEHLKRQKELGAYTKEDAENSKKFKQSLADLLQVWDSFTSFIGRLAVPVMKWLADVLTEVVVFLRQHTPFVVAAISLVGAALAIKLMPPLKELPKLISGVSRAFLRWLPFVAIIAGIALLIDDFYAYMTGGKSALEDFWAIFGTGEEISQNLTAAWKELKEIGLVLFAGAAAAVRAFWKVLGDWGVLDGLKNVLMGFGTFLKGLFTKDLGTAWKGLVQQLSGLGTILTAPVRAASAAVKQAVTDAWNSASTAVSEALGKIWTTITGWVDRIKAMVIEKITGIFSSIKVPSFLTNLFGGSEEEAEKAGGKIEDGMAKTAGAVEGGFMSTWTKASSAAVALFGGAAKDIRSLFGGIFADLQAQAQSMTAGLRAMAGGNAMVPAFAGVRAQNAGRGGNVTYNQSNKTNIYAGGGDPAQVQKAAERGQASANRNLVRPSASGTVPKG